MQQYLASSYPPSGNVSAIEYFHRNNLLLLSIYLKRLWGEMDFYFIYFFKKAGAIAVIFY